MQTDFSPELLATDSGQRAQEILRSCVHCGFCNATCPTYQVLGDELDGPRGRIYLIKDMLEAQAPNPRAQQHLDRCLTCRACETTCPSGVAYGELLEIGRNFMEPELTRPRTQRWLRRLLLWLVPDSARFARLTKLGRAFRWAVPNPWRGHIPPAVKAPAAAPVPAPDESTSKRTVILLDGCVQQAATPNTNRALEDLLHARGITTQRLAGNQCCGGANLHLADDAGALEHARVLLRAIEPHLETVDAVVSSASGCGVTLKEYARLLPADDELAPIAERFAAKVCDAAQLLQDLGPLEPTRKERRIAFHAPCTLQHGQRLPGIVEQILTSAGYELVPVADAHLCCGSAGTYSLTQPELARELRTRKLDALQAKEPELIASANVGCQLHLGGGTKLPVVHWLELVR